MFCRAQWSGGNEPQVRPIDEGLALVLGQRRDRLGQPRDKPVGGGRLREPGQRLARSYNFV